MSKTPAARADLLSLRLLVAAVDEGNLAAVATRENIALSGVSRRIATLEQRWGVQLLHRHDRGVRPTAALDEIIGRLRGVFLLLDQVADDIAALEGGARGLVRLSANVTAMSGMLGRSVARFVAAHPGIEIHLEEATSVEIVHALHVGTCDVGVVSGTLHVEGVHAQPWREDELVAVIPRGHVLEQQPAVRFAQLLDHPFIAMQKGSALQAMYRSRAMTIGRTIDERANVGGFSTVQTLVELGLGVAILPRIAVTLDPPGDVVVRPLDEPWSRRHLMVCTPLAATSNTARRFVRFLLEEEDDQPE